MRRLCSRLAQRTAFANLGVCHAAPNSTFWLKNRWITVDTRSHTEELTLPKLRLEGGRQAELRQVVLDLHANGEADGLPGASLRIVMPKDWRDLPRILEDPPFWASIWPSGSALAALLLQQTGLVAGKQVCDLGCGVGIAGIAAAVAGCRRVILADRNPHALRCASLGAAANGLTVESLAAKDSTTVVTTAALDWHDQNSAECLSAQGPFDVLLACDVLAEAGVVGMTAAASIAPIASLAHQLLDRDGYMLFVVPAESPYRPPVDLPLVFDAFAAKSLMQNGEIVELRGAQLPGEGPEGLAPSRKVYIIKFKLKTGS